MAGETALARQLKKLAVPQTTVLIQDKIRKSFLFDHRDAAGLDRDLIFAYGTNGIEKLRIINPMFLKFEANLFSLSYKDFERSVQSKDVNCKLDEKISEFLRMLSPYFLMKAAHEALEWLIYRFHIHMYNVDDLIASALPHFNTSTFVRVVQLFDLDEGSRWFWLKPVQKSGVHVDYSAILNRFISDGGFRKFVCDIAPNVLSVYNDNRNVASPIISFSMITIYNALVKCQIVDNKLITMLFPYILKGLTSELSKYVAASYLVISQIVVKVKLMPEITEELLIRIFRAAKEDLMNEAFQLLLLIFQNQSLKVMPKKVYSIILLYTESVNLLSTLAENFDAGSLFQAIIKRMISNLLITPTSKDIKKNKKAMRFLKGVLTNVKLDEKSVLFCFNLTLDKMTKCLKGKSIKKVQNQKVKRCRKMAGIVLQHVERKYPDVFDKAFKNFLEDKSKQNKATLCKLINNSVCSVKNKMVPDAKMSLVMGLYHANPQIRIISTLHFVQLIERKGIKDKEFFENSLRDRLLDKDPKVVGAILTSPEVVLRVVDKLKLLTAFKEIFKENIRLTSPWYPIFMKCLDIIVKHFCVERYLFSILPIILKFVFPVNKHTVEGLLYLLNSDMQHFFIDELRMLKSEIDKENMSNKKYHDINCKVIVALKKSIDNIGDLDIISYKVQCFQCNSFLSFFVYALQHMIIDIKSADTVKVNKIENLLEVFRFCFSQPNAAYEKFEKISDVAVVKETSIAITENKFPTTLIFHAFKNIITGIQLSSDDKPWPDVKSAKYRIIANLFDFCILHLNSHRENINAYFKRMLPLLLSRQLKNIQNIFMFLCTKWVDYEEDVPYVLQITSINIAATFCKTQQSMDWLFENDAVFFCLLLAIANSNTSISHSALNLLCSSLNLSKEFTHPLKFLAEEINMKSEKIKIDSRQCFDCVGNWLKPAADLVDVKSTHPGIELENKKLCLKKMLALLTEGTVSRTIKHFLLLCFKDVNSVSVLSAYIPVLYSFLSVMKDEHFLDGSMTHFFEIIELILKKFNHHTAECLNDDCKESKALLHCLKFVSDNDIQSSVQKFTLNVLNADFFFAIPSVKVQQEIFQVALELYINSPTSVNTKIEKVLRKLCNYAYLFLKHFQEKELCASKGTTLKEAKKSRIDENVDTFTIFEKGSWKKMTVFLEIMQNKSKLMQKEVLVPELFNLLNKTLDFESQAPVEYIRQLILSAIYNCCQQLGSEGLDERQFQVELIVQCIRSSTNAKTHHQSLLLLNLAARMFPDYVLSNVMSIFTFMGSSLVRQDDSYSFQVISQTIETIVPSLLEASHQQKETDGIQVVASVIRVFVDSLSDIPGHRQLPLFTKLLSTLDPSDYLWIPLGQICDQYATVFHDIMSDNSKNWKISPTLEFAVNLHKQFSPDIQIDTCVKLTNLLTMLPDTKQQFESNVEKYKQIKEPFNVVNRNDKQLQIYKNNVLSYMKIWLSSQEFLSQVSELNFKEQCNLEVKYELLLESILSLLQDQLNTKQCTRDSTDITSQVQLLYDLVHAMNSLLPCKLFIHVIKRLLKHSEVEIQMKAIEFLNTKLEQQHDLVQPENHKALQKLLRPLLKLVNKCINEESGGSKIAVIQQTALYALHLLCKLIGSEYPTKFYKVLNVSVQILSKYNQPELTVNALLCVAQLCSCLNVDILPHLNSFMPIIVNILQDKKVLNMNECLILGIIAALQSIVENLGMFLSSYMEAIVTGICKFSVRYTELGKKAISEKFERLQNKIATEIALRVLLTAVQSSYSNITTKTAKVVVPLMNILTDKLNSSSYEEILSSAPELQKFYLLLLDFRNCHQDLPLETTAQVENSIISSFETFVMKLSVTRFRTLFQKVYQWATMTIEDQEQKFKVYTFYKLTSVFSKSLKSLFAHMAKYFFRHVATVIDSINPSKSRSSYFEENSNLSHKLLLNIIDTLNCCFMHVEDQFLDKENFDILMQPLVDQIENLGDENQYQDLIENHLSSCIAYLMTAVSDNALWKTLNYQILLKTRHDSPKVRFGSLQVIQEVVNKMGDNYLLLLPESIPFLAEIMEDESTEVEQECQSVIIEMEKILGEPIRKYF